MQGTLSILRTIYALALKRPVVLLILAVVLGKAGIDIEAALRKSTTDYAYNVIAINFRSAETHEDILALVKQWKKDEWGAQLGALRTICDTDPDRLLTIGTAQQVTALCRLTK